VNVFSLRYLGREFLLIVSTSSSETALPRLIAKMERGAQLIPPRAISIRTFVRPSTRSTSWSGGAVAPPDSITGTYADVAESPHYWVVQTRQGSWLPRTSARIPRPASSAGSPTKLCSKWPGTAPESRGLAFQVVGVITW
jgi:hypothetical protein